MQYISFMRKTQITLFGKITGHAEQLLNFNPGLFFVIFSHFWGFGAAALIKVFGFGVFSR